MVEEWWLWPVEEISEEDTTSHPGSGSDDASSAELQAEEGYSEVQGTTEDWTDNNDSEYSEEDDEDEGDDSSYSGDNSGEDESEVWGEGELDESEDSEADSGEGLDEYMGVGVLQADALQEMEEDEVETATPWWLTVGEDGDDKGGNPTKQFSYPGRRMDQRFANAVDYLKYVTGECEVSDTQRYSQRGMSHGDDLVKSFQDAVNLAERGWPEGVEKAKALTSKLHRILVGQIPVKEIMYDVTGVQLDIGRFVNGEPEDFMQEVDSAVNVDQKPPSVVRIVTTVDIAGSQTFIMRGCAIAALAQILELHGIRVQIDVHIGTNDKIDTWLRVKEANWPVNLENLVYFTAHPSMFWRMSYSAWEHAPSSFRGAVGTRSMGWISEPVEEDRGDVYISAYGSVRLRNEKAALKWCQEQLIRVGIEVELSR